VRVGEKGGGSLGEFSTSNYRDVKGRGVAVDGCVGSLVL
jgi:hypothetical protein